MGSLLWQPSAEQMRNSNLYKFMQFVNKKHGQNFSQYTPLYEWSIENIADFWAAMWEFGEVKASKAYDSVVDDVYKLPGARWFSGARLNFAENLLRYRDDHTAFVFRGEDRNSVKMTYAEVYNEVARLAKSLRGLGIQPGDRVVGFMPNMPETAIAMLAAASIGATWSSCSPDFGTKGVLDRFGQIQPRVLFTADGYTYKGKRFDSLERIAHVLEELPTIEKVVVVPYIEEKPDIRQVANTVDYRDFKSFEENLVIDFEQLPFEHPLFIMYTSGTTGLPKCLVQSAGGILLNHLRELMIHSDVNREDTIFYFTTCGWMMWNWLISSLALGATIALYDGNPFHPEPGVLWRMAEEEEFTIFGTSAGYIAALQNSGAKPGKEFDLKPLKAVLSTGSPLSVESFEYIYREVKEDVQLASICGGTDINGCFFLGNAMGPVYAGELQCRGLGMKVETFDENGKSVINQQGELVCLASIPSMPTHFWNDPDGEKYHSAYFETYPNAWRHGDWIEINDRGGVIVYGRSDATLNPGGVRIGTAEIYRQVEQFKEIEDSIVVGQDWKNDVRILLFVRMADGFDLNEDLRTMIKKNIRVNCSPRHVPAKIIAVRDIPYTLNMKKVELAVRKVIHKQPVLNKDSLRNPETLDDYANLKGLLEE
jgi:acetoacetyl-CoA synthetase